MSRDGEQPLGMAQLLTGTSAVAVLVSILYLLGYQGASGFPVLALVRLDDLLTLSIPMLALVIFANGLGYLLRSAYPSLVEPAKTRGARYFDRGVNVLFVGFCLYLSVSRVVRGEPFTRSIMVWFLPLVWYWSYVLYRSKFGVVLRDHLRVIPETLLWVGGGACILTLLAGIQDGARASVPAPNNITVALNDGTHLRARVKFSLGDFLILRDGSKGRLLAVSRSEVKAVIPILDPADPAVSAASEAINVPAPSMNTGERSGQEQPPASSPD